MLNLSERSRIFPSIFLGAGLFVIGLMAANYIINSWWPFDINRLDLVRATVLDRVDAASLLDAANSEIILAFLAAILVTVTGLALPLAYLLNQRFGRYGRPSSSAPAAPQLLVTLRQSMGVGLWAAFCVWLRMNRALGLAVALLVAAVIVLFEVMLQIRARAASVTID